MKKKKCSYSDVALNDRRTFPKSYSLAETKLNHAHILLILSLPASENAPSLSDYFHSFNSEIAL